MSSEAKKTFNIRAFVSVLSGLIFVSMVVTGLALFFAPSCRAARETNWSFLGHGGKASPNMKGPTSFARKLFYCTPIFLKD